MKKLRFATLKKIAITLLTFCHFQLVCAQNWSAMSNVQVQDISIGADGQVWVTGKDNSIMRWNGTTLEKIKGSAKRISVGADGIPWIVNASGKIAHYDSDSDQWLPVAGTAKDIGAGTDGSIWIVGTTPIDGGFEVSIWNSETNNWDAMGFGAMRIAVDGSGNPWIVTDANKIFIYQDEELHEYGDEMLDVSIGADGSVWAISTGNEILNLGEENWEAVEGQAISIAAAEDGSPWIVNMEGKVAAQNSVEKTEVETEAETEVEAEAETEAETEVETKKEKPQEETNKQEENKPEEKNTLEKMKGTFVDFINAGNKPVEVYKSSSSKLGDLVTEIRPNSRVKIPVNIGDEFEIGINKEIGRHPKIYITNTKNNVSLFGNGPLKDVQFLAEKFSILDYQSNQSGIDLTKYNPRDLVNTINKGRIFEPLNVVEGIDYRIVGDGKIMKYGFDYASANHHEGSNQVSMSYGYNSFSKNWSLNVGGSGSIPIKGGSVNPAMDFGYSESELENKSYENTYAYSREQKSLFTISVDPKKAPLDQEFKDAVLSVTDSETANEFVNRYGTHYPKTVYYGGDRSVYVVFNKEQYSKAKSFGIDLKAKVGVSKMKTKGQTFDGEIKKGSKPKETSQEAGEVGEGHLGFEYRQGSEEESVFENTISKYRMIGGSGGFENWDVDEKNAAPIASEMDPIYTLIDPQIFKDGTNPSDLAKAKLLIKAAVDNKLKSMPLLKAPLPPPNVYSISIEKMEVIQELDDANKNTKGNIYAEITMDEKGKMKLQEINNQYLWSNPDYSLEFKFVKGTVYYPRTKPFTFTHFPDAQTGQFLSLAVNIKGNIAEKDDLLGKEQDEMTGETGNILIKDLNLSPGQSTSSRTFDVSYFAFAKENRIRITYKIRREPSEFDDKLIKL